ncbi:hypothetical protein [Lactiplantibacillus plantarum]|uniref:hypothetical protein n=1 Tax=Lactiplantibacillus plantarum TaxID=1590 RepID=UPI002000BBCD|nr:hypothetical protein [Lactiplantibacillus plantarum]
MEDDTQKVEKNRSFSDLPELLSDLNRFNEIVHELEIDQRDAKDISDKLLDTELQYENIKTQYQDFFTFLEERMQRIRLQYPRPDVPEHHLNYDEIRREVLKDD